MNYRQGGERRMPAGQWIKKVCPFRICILLGALYLSWVWDDPYPPDNDFSSLKQTESTAVELDIEGVTSFSQITKQRNESQNLDAIESLADHQVHPPASFPNGWKPATR